MEETRPAEGRLARSQRSAEARSRALRERKRKRWEASDEEGSGGELLKSAESSWEAVEKTGREGRLRRKETKADGGIWRGIWAFQRARRQPRGSAASIHAKMCAGDGGDEEKVWLEASLSA